MTPGCAGPEGPAGMASNSSMTASSTSPAGMGDMGSTDGLPDMRMYGSTAPPTASEVFPTLAASSPTTSARQPPTPQCRPPSPECRPTFHARQGRWSGCTDWQVKQQWQTAWCTSQIQTVEIEPLHPVSVPAGKRTLRVGVELRHLPGSPHISLQNLRLLRDLYAHLTLEFR
jgi:hypothetical protein